MLFSSALAGAYDLLSLLKHWPSLTCDSKTAGIQYSILGCCNIDFEAKFLKGPAVGLSHVLPRGSDVGLRYKETSQAYMDVL